jgi:hypothetical protein
VGLLTTAKTQLGVGGPTKNYARPIGAKALSVPPVRAITWIGLGGPGINRTRPLGAKAEAVGGVGGGVLRNNPMMKTLGKMMNR